MAWLAQSQDREDYVGSQLVSTLPICYGEVTNHALGQDGHNRVLPVPTVGQTVNASAEVGAWHTLAPPKRGSPATLRLAHSVPVPCGTNLGLSPFGFRVNSSAPSRNGTGWICTNLVMYLQFTRLRKSAVGDFEGKISLELRQKPLGRALLRLPKSGSSLT